MGFTRQSLEKSASDALRRGINNPGFFIGREEQAPGLPYFILSMDPMGQIRLNGTVYTERYDADELMAFWNQALAGEEGNTEALQGF